MIVRLLHVSVILFFGIGIASFIFTSINPTLADLFFATPWINTSLKILMFILLIAAMTNFLRMYSKEKEVRWGHAVNAVMISIVVMVIIDWRNGWPVLSSFF